MLYFHSKEYSTSKVLRGKESIYVYQKKLECFIFQNVWRQKMLRLKFIFLNILSNFLRMKAFNFCMKEFSSDIFVAKRELF